MREFFGLLQRPDHKETRLRQIGRGHLCIPRSAEDQPIGWAKALAEPHFRGTLQSALIRQPAKPDFQVQHLKVLNNSAFLPASFRLWARYMPRFNKCILCQSSESTKMPQKPPMAPLISQLSNVSSHFHTQSLVMSHQLGFQHNREFSCWLNPFTVPAATEPIF